MPCIHFQASLVYIHILIVSAANSRMPGLVKFKQAQCSNIRHRQVFFFMIRFIIITCSY